MDPATEALIIQGIISIGTQAYAYIASLADADRQAAIDRLKAAHKQAVADVAQFDTDSASDLAAAAAEIDVIEAQNKAGHVL